MIVALIQNNKVVGLLEIAGEEEQAELGKRYQATMDVTERANFVKIGWDFNGWDIYSPDTGPARRITKLAFRNRFTSNEKVTLYTAAATNPLIKIWIDDLANSTFVDLARPDTIASVNGMALVGLITSDRAVEILTNPIQEIEKYYREVV